jgi:hypothetical protein
MDIAEQAFPARGAYRHEVRAGLGIIVIPHPDGTAMMDVRIECHIGNDL